MSHYLSLIFYTLCVYLFNSAVLITLTSCFQMSPKTKHSLPPLPSPTPSHFQCEVAEHFDGWLPDFCCWFFFNRLRNYLLGIGLFWNYLFGIGLISLEINITLLMCFSWVMAAPPPPTPGTGSGPDHHYWIRTGSVFVHLARFRYRCVIPDPLGLNEARSDPPLAKGFCSTSGISIPGRMVNDRPDLDPFSVKSKETVGNSWTVLKVILGHKYHNH